MTRSLAPTLRAAEPADWAFLDHLQRRYHHAIGYLSRAALAEAIDRRRVLLALENGEPAGYVYGKAHYQRRADVAIIFQAAVSYDARRRLLGTALVDAFARSLAPSVNQMCLWCATDLDASLFWSALGFRAVASRDGARRSRRTHALWCRHVHDAQGPFWIPESTRGGVMREVRSVQPMPTG
ncbi:GNAT family N-acetyltransferase [Frigoriglobus tundricola]|uniref:N-acetyltransferase domain-containing protein n=1 Tax=Frigoriglobus tundricola TaxID=2774151 RepID=A0A6M5YZL8_9BACT|nr:GNAT family N-acetyltransferase [Frigoriglobus tundricola]QJW98673.1 hypothetical protein FTUN_6268 [Frigoriglobus tundricola]